MKTQDARSLPPKAQEDMCRKAVKVVLDGRKKKEVAEIFGVTRQAIGKWVRTYIGSHKTRVFMVVSANLKK